MNLKRLSFQHSSSFANLPYNSFDYSLADILKTKQSGNKTLALLFPDCRYARPLLQVIISNLRLNDWYHSPTIPYSRPRNSASPLNLPMAEYPGFVTLFRSSSI